jgi:hypothetical protein
MIFLNLKNPIPWTPSKPTSISCDDVNRNMDKKHPATLHVLYDKHHISNYNLYSDNRKRAYSFPLLF